MTTQRIVFPLFGYDNLAAKLPGTIGRLNVHTFPDGESLIKIETPIKDAEVIFVCSLEQPNNKILTLFFAARTARDLGAKRIGLIVPYLPYMRQDKIFHEGEGITSVYFASLISEHFDWMFTVEPHLHRWHDLSEIYSIPAHVIRATDPIASWIVHETQMPVLIGPDAESEQWVCEIAKKTDCPFVVLQKNRLGDKDVEIVFPDMKAYQNHQPILVDDIISSGATMIAAVKHLNSIKMKPPICIGVHALFAGEAYENLEKSGITRLITCNTINHPSNGIDLAGTIGEGLSI